MRVTFPVSREYGKCQYAISMSQISLYSGLFCNKIIKRFYYFSIKIFWILLDSNKPCINSTDFVSVPFNLKLEIPGLFTIVVPHINTKNKSLLIFRLCVRFTFVIALGQSSHLGACWLKTFEAKNFILEAVNLVQQRAIQYLKKWKSQNLIPKIDNDYNDFALTNSMFTTITEKCGIIQQLIHQRI